MKNRFLSFLGAVFISTLSAYGQFNTNTYQLQSNAIQFVENNGQWHENVIFRSPLGYGAVFLEENTFTYVQYEMEDMEEAHAHSGEGHQHEQLIDGHAWKAHFVGANENPSVSGEGKRPEYHNYFIGNDRSKWASRVGIYDYVNYESLYDGIGMRVYDAVGTFKYDFIVDAGVNPDVIQMEFEGLEGLSLDRGNLVMETTVGNFMENAPIAYQNINDVRIPVACNFVVKGNMVSFEFPEGYDTSHQLIIDPELIGATLSGGTATNYGHCATYDNDGNIYTGARSFGPGYPTDAGSFQTDHGGSTDMAFSKFNTDASALIYATYLGGSGSDLPHSMVVGDNDELYVFGTTKSLDHPTADDAFDTTGPDGGINADIVVAHFTEDGTDIVGCTFVGGDAADGENNLTTNYADTYRGEIIVDSDGNCYVATSTQSTDFPVTPGAYQETYGGGVRDAVVFSMNEELTAMNWSTYIGGTNDEGAFSLRLDYDDDIYVCGVASDAFVPMTGYIDTYQGGTRDAFVLRLTDEGTAIPQATFWGTESTDAAFFMDLDNDGNVFLYGQSNGGTSEVTEDVYVNEGSHQFICKLTPTLDELEFGTVVGDGGANFVPIAFMVDACGYIYFSGHSVSGTMPLTDDALYETGGFYLGVLQPEAADLEFATLYSGNHVDGGTSRFDPANGEVYQAVCSCEAFTTTEDAYADTKVGFCDVAVFKIDFGISHVNANADAAPSQEGCAPFTVDFENGSLGLTYEWDFDDGSAFSTDFEPTHTFTDPGVYNVRLVAFDPEGCLTSDTTYLEIVVGSGETPEASFDYDVNCATGEVSVTYTGTEGAISVFDMGDGTVIADDEFTHTYSSDGAFTITLTAGDGVCADFATAEEEVVIGSPAVDLIFNQPTCFGFSDGSITVDIADPEGTELIEITDPTGEILNVGGSNTANTLNSGWYYFLVDLGDGCALYDSIQLMDPPQLNTQLNIVNPLCYGDETGYVVADTVFNYQGEYDEITYIWAPDAVGASGLGGDSLWNLGVGEFTLTLNDDNGCSRVFDFEITEPSELVFSEFGHDPAFCRVFDYQNGNGQVFAAATGGTPHYDYLWTNLTTDATSINSTWGGLNPAEYEITVTDENGCILRDTILMDTVNPIAAFDVISSELNQDCQGTAPVSVTFVNQSEYFSNLNDPFTDTVFFWTLDNPNMQWVLSEDYFEQFDTTYLDGGTYDVCLIAQNKNGCKDTTCKPIVIYDELVFDIVNIFSPDGDGVNDEFTFIYRSDAVKDFSCIVVNRWGVVVAEFDEITDTWDGTNKNGTPVPDGVYFYNYAGQAENSEEFSGQGTVQIVSMKE